EVEQRVGAGHPAGAAYPAQPAVPDLRGHEPVQRLVMARQILRGPGTGTVAELAAVPAGNRSGHPAVRLTRRCSTSTCRTRTVIRSPTLSPAVCCVSGSRPTTPGITSTNAPNGTTAVTTPSYRQKSRQAASLSAVRSWLFVPSVFP